ncbi:bifunctional DNA-formamidopyrimidine glycosylase/DNA-(apurinic or apyrimidinic site) lyase [Phytoactinopolyspora halotolerans]|uniref:Formamidopyrimidine-DNA glycosylase n=1 Tax=Phytoactinopolyspora halotolerans TaxID=1981512 RepID=A0A6L9SEX4_9ACTN|nr:bifunctional DNA-formamidopyrimidine glycosylase/DNA-(apurinic or apyrimidinic site) lyase [Phytoactinopolyspora halotolerans]NEE03639.1 bifunctional DNA-formamidopyrimidine glycosylase/DNA-(apurinic or apyrimidinic site) lyase [Phytoactinopolyspora halotolerans]
MPELPEVEVVRRGLAEHVAGRRIARVDVLHPRAVRRHAAGPADFASSLVGAAIDAPRRRGKYLWLPLVDRLTALAAPGREQARDARAVDARTVHAPTDDVSAGRAILGHLGMSGQLLLQPSSAPDGAHLRVRFVFDDGGPELRFVDQRTFGGLAIHPTDGAGVPVVIGHIARDPLEPEFDVTALIRALRRRRTGIKRALLDQSLISGVGNIYADEALWRARLHYARPTETLRSIEVQRLVEAVHDVMKAALNEGGTSFDRLYVNVNGESGYFDRSLQVYGREGEPCGRCGSAIRRDPFMNRSSYTCPRCQPRPRRARW